MYAAYILKSFVLISKSISATSLEDTDSGSQVDPTSADIEKLTKDVHDTKISEGKKEDSTFQKQVKFIEKKSHVLHDVEDAFKVLLRDNGHKFYTVLDSIIEKYINKQGGCFSWKQKEEYVYKKNLPIEEHIPEFLEVIKKIKEVKPKNNALAALKVFEEMVGLIPYCFELTEGLSQMIYKADSSDETDLDDSYKLYCDFRKRLNTLKNQMTVLRCQNDLFFEEFFRYENVEKFFVNTDGFFEVLNKEINSAYVTIDAFFNELVKIYETGFVPQD
ncbi:hypothetical protein ENBRE01_0817 [Enteropsectra breve]|nr:hypothetical protein ENBRE01_0817 [Enteropsectra breve]